MISTSAAGSRYGAAQTISNAVSNEGKNQEEDYKTLNGYLKGKLWSIHEASQVMRDNLV